MVWGMTHGEALEAMKTAGDGGVRALGAGTTPARVLADMERLEAGRDQVAARMAELEAVYREYGWTRFFPCGNRDGHIHSSLRGCSSVQWDTDMGWEPALSGHTVGEAVAKLGPTLCSKCFPGAPAEQCRSRVDLDREARDAARSARDAVKAAKNLTGAQEFRDHRNDRVATVAGCKAVLRDEVELRDYYGRGAHPWHARSAEASGLARRVLLEREAANPGTGATEAEVDRIIANAVKLQRKYGARI